MEEEEDRLSKLGKEVVEPLVTKYAKEYGDKLTEILQGKVKSSVGNPDLKVPTMQDILSCMNGACGEPKCSIHDETKKIMGKSLMAGISEGIKLGKGYSELSSQLNMVKSKVGKKGK